MSNGDPTAVPAPVPAGWYPDPATAGYVRWWDGRSWTTVHLQAQPGPSPYVVAYAPPPNPARDLADELKWGRLAAIGVRLVAACFVGQLLAVAIVVKPFVDAFRRNIDTLDANPNATVTPFSGINHGYFAVVGVFYLLSFLSLGGLVLLIIWLYSAATFAQRAGVPARLAPIWAILGFVVPVVNFWFPYQSAHDVFPAGHPGQRTTGWWWACYLGQSVMIIPVGVAAIFSVPAGLVAAVALAVVPILTAHHAVRMIAAAAQAHQDLVAG